MPNGAGEALESFTAPLEAVIAALGKGIADAQSMLDRNSIATQETLDTDPVLAPYRMQATWYQFPRVDLQLKMAVSMLGEGESSGPALPAAGPGAPGALRLLAHPVSAAYQNHFNYDASASSTLTLAIAPVPPPAVAAQATTPPHLSVEDVRMKALGNKAGFKTVTDARGQMIPDPKLRFDMNFNAAARAWYVMQYSPTDPSIKAIIVRVDDVTGDVRQIST